MSKGISIDDMAEAIEKELMEYRELAADELKTAVKKAGRTAKSDIGKSAPERTGAYAKSWRMKVTEESSVGIGVTVYSPSHYMLAHPMSHIPVLPFEAVGMDPAFEGLKTNSAEENPFTIEKEGAFGTALANPFKVSEPNNLRALLFGSEGSLIDTFGGEWEFDHFRAILHKERGKDRGVTIRYGKNLTDLKQEENIQNTYTGICPYWKGLNEDGTERIVYLPEKVLHSTSASNYPYQRTKVVDFSSDFEVEPTAEELRARGEDYIKDNDIGTPTVSLDVSFIALHETQEYADMTRIYHIKLKEALLEKMFV